MNGVSNVVPALTLLLVAAIFAAPVWLLVAISLWLVGELVCVIFAAPHAEQPIERHRRPAYQPPESRP